MPLSSFQPFFLGLGMPTNPIIGWATNLDTESNIIQKNYQREIELNLSL